MKSRGFIRCVCCGADIPVGAQFLRYAGGSWLPGHLTAYRASRAGRPAPVRLHRINL